MIAAEDQKKSERWTQVTGRMQPSFQAKLSSPLRPCTLWSLAHFPCWEPLSIGVEVLHMQCRVCSRKKTGGFAWRRAPQGSDGQALADCAAGMCDVPAPGCPHPSARRYQPQHSVCTSAPAPALQLPRFSPSMLSANSWEGWVCATTPSWEWEHQWDWCWQSQGSKCWQKSRHKLQGCRHCYPNCLISECKSKPSCTLPSAEFGFSRRFLFRQDCLHFLGYGTLLVFRKGSDAGGQAGMQSLWCVNQALSAQSHQWCMLQPVRTLGVHSKPLCKWYALTSPSTCPVHGVFTTFTTSEWNLLSCNGAWHQRASQ